MRKISVPIFMLSTIALLSSCSSDPTENPQVEENAEYILHDALNVDSKVEFKLNSGEAVKWSITQGTDNSKPKATAEKSKTAKLDVKAGKNTITATFDNGTTISADIYVPTTTTYNIDLSEGHTFISNGDKGSLYVYGKNDNGQLCLPKSTASVKDPEVLLSGKNVVSVATGDKHSLYTDGVDVFGCGDNSKGQLGIGNTNAVDKATKITTLKPLDKQGKPVEKVADKIVLKAGGDMSTAVVNTTDTSTSSGTLYLWGYDVINPTTNINAPKFVATTDNSFHASSDINFSVGNNFVVSRVYGSANVYSLGINDKWQLGRVKGNNKYISGNPAEFDEKLAAVNPFKNHNKNENDMDGGYVYVPYGEGREVYADEASSRNYIQSTNFIRIATGKDFTVILKKDPRVKNVFTDTVGKYAVYVWGNNDKGQLGINDKDSTLLGLDNDKTSLGNATPIFSGKQSKMESDPTTDNYDLTYKFVDSTETNKPDFTPIKDTNIVNVAAGDATGYALDEDGTLYGWGDNSKKQLTDSTQPIASQKIVKISAPDKVKFEDIWAGGNRAIALGSDKQLYTWGDGIATPTKMFFKADKPVITEGK